MLFFADSKIAQTILDQYLAQTKNKSSDANKCDNSKGDNNVTSKGAIDKVPKAAIPAKTSIPANAPIPAPKPIPAKTMTSTPASAPIPVPKPIPAKTMTRKKR